MEAMKNQHTICYTKKSKLVKPLKIRFQRLNEKLTTKKYDNDEEDVEWVYDIDVETDET